MAKKFRTAFVSFLTEGEIAKCNREREVERERGDTGDWLFAYQSAVLYICWSALH